MCKTEQETDIIRFEIKINNFKVFSIIFQTFTGLINHHDGGIAASNLKRMINNALAQSKQKCYYLKKAAEKKRKYFLLIRPIFSVVFKRVIYTAVRKIFWSKTAPK